jgi:Protein of unknown function (DUF2950)
LRRSFFSVLGLIGFAIAVVAVVVWSVRSARLRPIPPGMGLSPTTDGQLTFATPDAAMTAVMEACSNFADEASLEKLFGAGAAELIWSGDVDADRETSLRVVELIKTKLSFVERSPGLVFAELGDDDWRFPIPLVETPEGWRFDLEGGKDELLTRRIGHDELDTVATMYEYVEAQKEYVGAGRDGNPPAYAQNLRSTAGKHDGLYWESKEGEAASPLGELVADARKEGVASNPGAELQPFNGYHYRILTKQGANAPGGRKSYVDEKGLMTKGFAAIAWPAEYGRTGMMTFVVSEVGVVFQKDLGPETGTITRSITEYDPDSSWSPVARPPDLEDR